MKESNLYNEYMDKKSPKLEKEISDYVAESIKPGDVVNVNGKYLRRNSSQDSEWVNNVKVKEVNGETVTVYNGYKPDDTCDVHISNCKKNTFMVGAQPFPKENWRSGLRISNRDMTALISMIFPYLEYEVDGLDGKKHVMNKLNWNPYVFNKDGEKEYYQRDFCWTLKDKQLFIESIYNRIDCGMFVFRKRSYKFVEQQIKNGDYEAAFYDIVDGKQRIEAIRGFVCGEYPDMHGNYYTDFSEYARRLFEDSMCFSYAELEEEATDADVLKTFLNVNFTGVKMSQEHIDYVKEINKKL